MTPRVSLALKLMVPGLAVAVLAFHGISRIVGGQDAKSVLAAPAANSRGPAATPGRPSRVDDAAHQVGAVRSAVDGVLPQRDDGESMTDIDGDQDLSQPAQSRVSQPAWWWPFGSRTEPEPPPTQREPSGVFVRLESPRTGGAASASSADLIEFVAITRSGGTMPGDEFSVGQTRDLKIVVWWALNSQHVQRLELVSPDGSLYQRLQTSFDADTSKLVQRGNQSYVSVETILPVAGTWITDHSLFGTWTVNVYLDGDTATSRNASFVVNP
jgi:hypothetical protein